MEATTFSQFFFNGNFLAVLGAALAVGLGGIGSAKGVGIAGEAAAGINVVAKRPNEVSKAMIYAAMVETYAILGLLISILLVINVGNVA